MLSITDPRAEIGFEVFAPRQCCRHRAVVFRHSPRDPGVLSPAGKWTPCDRMPSVTGRPFDKSGRRGVPARRCITEGSRSTQAQRCRAGSTAPQYSSARVTRETLIGRADPADGRAPAPRSRQADFDSCRASSRGCAHAPGPAKFPLRVNRAIVTPTSRTRGVRVECVGRQVREQPHHRVLRGSRWPTRRYRNERVSAERQMETMFAARDSRRDTREAW